jgi:DNA modification methylase
MTEVIQGDCLDVLPTLEAESVQTVVTSPPYWGLRDYGCKGQLGLEETPEQYVIELVWVFRQIKRVLRNDGTLWVNLGDSYCSTAPGTMGDKEHLINGAAANARRNFRPETPPGLKPKDLCMMPARVAMALQADGWFLRSEIVWHKPNPMPESVTDRPTKSHEMIYLLSKRASYFYDADAVRESHSRDWSEGKAGGTLGRGGRKKLQPQEGDPNYRNGHSQWERQSYPEMNPDGRNKRSVWTVATAPFSDAHFATFPPDLIKPCILAGSRVGDTVLDPFAGSGTVGLVATEYGRKSVLIELNPAYVAMIHDRTNVTVGML